MEAGTDRLTEKGRETLKKQMREREREKGGVFRKETEAAV